MTAIISESRTIELFCSNYFEAMDLMNKELEEGWAVKNFNWEPCYEGIELSMKLVKLTEVEGIELWK